MFKIQKILLLISIMLLTNKAIAIPLPISQNDEDFLRAREAYDKKSSVRLFAYVQKLQGENYILAPYADYWLMLLNLEDVDQSMVKLFLEKYKEFPFADRLRGEYLKKLGKEQDWMSFSEELVNYHSGDVAVACYAAEMAIVNSELNAREKAIALWMQAKEQPANCSSLFDRMQANKILSESDIMARLSLALAANRLNLAKSIVKRSENFNEKQITLIDKAYTAPLNLLAKKLSPFNTRYGRLINLFALARIADVSSSQSIEAFGKIENNLKAEDKSAFYANLAQEAALRQEPESLTWFQKANSADFTKEQFAWYARTALRQKNWQELLKVCDEMDREQADEGVWRYWKARALKATNQAIQANALFAKLSTERHFYGWLAQDELEEVISSAPVSYKATEEDVRAIEVMPSFQRIEALQRLDFRWEAKLEWASVTKDFDDRALLSAADFAYRKKWYDLAIITADKTSELHDFSLRYPTPYRDLMMTAATQQGVDESWVYAITRQESRFMHNAKSGVGAAGLMQIMPATAKWVAPRAGISNYNMGMIHDLDTNITLGTYYLSHTLQLFNGQEVMATAAYNAGPGRAKKWAADIPLEGAIYAETIPFGETRNYVQKVMANTYLYAQRLGMKSLSLKKRLGVIPAKNGIVMEEDPDIGRQEINE